MVLRGAHATTRFYHLTRAGQRGYRVAESGELGEAELAEPMPEWLERYGRRRPKSACCLRQASRRHVATWPGRGDAAGVSIAERVSGRNCQAMGRRAPSAEPKTIRKLAKARLNLKRPRRRSVVR